MSVENYVEDQLSKGIYSFSTRDLFTKESKSQRAVFAELGKLTTERKIAKLRTGFYLILPPIYRRLGNLPLVLYVNDLFDYLGMDYYVGLYTASQKHGAAHQKIMEDFIMVPRPMRNIKKPAASINFLTTTNWPEKGITKKKGPAGMYNLSGPVLTAADLIYHQNRLGGINRMLANIEELSEEMTIDQIQDLATWYPHLSTLQRLGFLLDKVGDGTNLGDVLFESLGHKKMYPVLLVPNSIETPVSLKNRWKIDVNLELESDLW